MKLPASKISAICLASTLLGSAAAFPGTSLAASMGSNKPAAAEKTPAQNSVAQDAYLKGRLDGALAYDPNVNSYDIDTAVENGVVHLAGIVRHPIERDLATEIARGIDGVTDVKSDIQVSQDLKLKAAGHSSANKLGQTLDDAAITTAIKSRLFANSNTSGMAVSVTTRNGVVALTGTTRSKAEKDLVTRIARNQSGVVDVDNSLVVKEN